MTKSDDFWSFLAKKTIFGHVFWQKTAHFWRDMKKLIADSDSAQKTTPNTLLKVSIGRRAYFGISAIL